MAFNFGAFGQGVGQGFQAGRGLRNLMIGQPMPDVERAEFEVLPEQPNFLQQLLKSLVPQQVLTEFDANGNPSTFGSGNIYDRLGRWTGRMS